MQFNLWVWIIEELEIILSEDGKNKMIEYYNELENLLNKSKDKNFILLTRVTIKILIIIFIAKK